ncbi:MAG: primosomal protein N' [Ruminococcaceae bacterium]|nr:primosomal protein N' [Oscillospiraceae bacterium]
MELGLHSKCAGVCLLDNPFTIDGIYDYRIPEELADEVRVGVFVTVPFGTANRRALALVCEVRDHSAFGELKAIVSVCPEKLSLDKEMQGLCQFMKLRTLCSTGDAVRAILPASALSRLITLYTVSPDHILTDSDELPSSDLFVYDFIREKGECALTLLREKLGAGVELRLRRLCARGYLQKRVVLKDASEGLCERICNLLPSAAAASLLASGEKVDGIKLTSEAQRRVVRSLLEAGTALSVTALKAGAEVTEAPIKTLASKGILAITSRRVERNPYATATFVGQTPIQLNEEQSAALETLTSLARSGEPRAALLHGVTGSGKTSVMTVLIDRLLERGRGVILLLPEIALTPQSVSIFCARYGERVAVIHSGLSAGERYDAYCRIREGRADVVIGTRSAVFSPVKNLGAIIIDEEQEHTYKSDQNPKYHARDIARYRCAEHGALMLLASATPSLESYQKAKAGIYTLVRLTQRYGGARLPEVEIADMRREIGEGNTSPLGRRLIERLFKTAEAGEQSILFLNRRGYNHFLSCRSCGEAVTCPSCSVSMTYHTRRGTYTEGDMVCHWCGRRMPLPKTCPSCGSEHLARMGFGTQRVEEELKNLLPNSRVLRMDTDTTSTKFSYDEMLGQFRSHEADVLLGTQMVTKGHDFPDVTLVGVLLADASLYLDDYRASERTFSMLTQVIGRAGRGSRPGVAVIQTNNPDSEIIRLACAQDYESFYEREIRLRKLLVFPPYCDIVLLTTVGREEGEVIRASRILTEELRVKIEHDYSDTPIILFGPFEAPVYRVDNKYRMRTVIKCKLNKKTLALFSETLCDFSAKAGKLVTLSVDFNPSNL